MNIFTTNIYLFITATVLAVMEIQIEGQNGWAKNLPTWKPASHKWYAKLYTKIMSGKEMTGYHLSIFSLVFLILGFPFVMGLPLNLENILKIFSLYILICAVWDFLWFVLNPHYPLRKFKKEHLAFHHPKWFLGIPTDYWGASIITFFLALLGQFLWQVPDMFKWWAVNYVLLLIQVCTVVLFSLFVLKIDNWHNPKP